MEAFFEGNMYIVIAETVPVYPETVARREGSFGSSYNRIDDHLISAVGGLT